MAHLLVLGGGFGGLAAAHELRRRLPSGDEVTVVAASDRFFVGFAKLWDLTGRRPLAEGSRPLERLNNHGIRYVRADITELDPQARTVTTSAGTLQGDGMVIALGAGYQSAHTALLGGDAYNLYDAAALPDMRAALAALTEGRVLVGILGAPYLCPPAPFEAAMLVHESIRRRGLDDRVEVVVSTPQPLTLPVAGPDASRYLAGRLSEYGVTVLTEHPVEMVDHDSRTVRFDSGETLQWRLLLGVPGAAPPPVLAASTLAAPSGWIQPDRHTAATTAERVYAVGDCTMVPTAAAQLPKAGVFAEAAGRVAATNLTADLYGGDRASLDGHGFCYLELPGDRAAMVRGDFYAEPRADVAITDPDTATFQAKQRWEQEHLATWLG